MAFLRQSANYPDGFCKLLPGLSYSIIRTEASSYETRLLATSLSLRLPFFAEHTLLTRPVFFNAEDIRYHLFPHTYISMPELLISSSLSWKICPEISCCHHLDNMNLSVYRTNANQWSPNSLKRLVFHATHLLYISSKDSPNVDSISSISVFQFANTRS